MEPVRNLMKSWGIINPAEFFFGLGVCILVPLLAVSAAFRLFFLRGCEHPGTGWRQWFRGVLGCCLCSAGLVLVFTPPLFHAPDVVPDGALALMLAGVAMAAPGLLVLLTAVLPGMRSLRKPGGGGEKPWARTLIYLLPLGTLFPLFARLYGYLGIH
jgi:hypothetical protein